MPPDYFALPEDYVPHQAWALRLAATPVDGNVSVKSFACGVGGLGIGFLLTSLVLPTIAWFLFQTIGFDKQLVTHMLTFQFVAWPLLALFGLCVAAPLLWHGSVLTRFAAAVASIAIPCFILIEYLDQANDLIFAEAMLVGASILFFASASVAIMYQWWTPWSLSPFSARYEPIRPMGIRSIIELTFIVAIGCAIVGTNTSDQIATVAGLASVAGVLLCMIVILAIYVSMRRSAQWWSQTAGVVGLVFVVVLLGNLLFAFTNSKATMAGGPSFEHKFFLALTHAVLGSVVMLVTLLLGIRWLQACGWHFLNRKEPTMADYSIGAHCLTGDAIRSKMENRQMMEARPLSEVKPITSALRIPYAAWVLRRLDLPEKASVSRTSFMAGLVGLAAALAVIGVAMPIAARIAEKTIGNSPTYIVLTLVTQSIALPAFTLVCLATATAMFWYGSVFQRFAIAIVTITPGLLSLTFTISLLERDGVHASDMITFGSMVFVQLLAGASVAILIQFWTPWTLTHLRASNTPLPPMGIRSMIELTAVAAICFLLFGLVDVFDLFESLVFFAIVGVVGTFGCTRAMIVFLGDRKGNRTAIAFAMGVTFVLAFAINTFFAVMEFGWDAVPRNLLYIIGPSLYGAGLLFGLVWLPIAWLRGCGWQCVNRRMLRDSGVSPFASASDP